MNLQDGSTGSYVPDIKFPVGSANTVTCWKADGITLGFATVAEITVGTCH